MIRLLRCDEYEQALELDLIFGEEAGHIASNNEEVSIVREHIMAIDYILGAFDNNTLIGTVGIQAIDTGTILISSFGTLPEHRKKGIGSKLLSSAVCLCDTLMPSGQQILLVSDSNHKAIKLYNQFGYNRVSGFLEESSIWSRSSFSNIDLTIPKARPNDLTSQPT